MVETRLINRLHLLLNDHKKENQNCKHCILRYKKSSLVLNLFIGDLAQNFPRIFESTFAPLSSAWQFYTKEEPGLLITTTHSLTRRQNPSPNTIIHIPFMVITKDAGFFKNNLAIHCTENRSHLYDEINSSQRSFRETIVSKFKPARKANRDCLGVLDNHFWRYFMKLEDSFINNDEIIQPYEEEAEEEIPINKQPSLKASEKGN